MVQAYISKKASQLDKYIQLKGKLDLARKASDIKPAKTNATDTDPLVYKDESDVDSQRSDSAAEDSEEEIKEIPLGQPKKRRHVDINNPEADSEEEFADHSLSKEVDDSVSSYTSRSDDD